MKVVRWAIISLLMIAVLLLLLPGIAYVAGLARVDGRPVPADPTHYSKEAIDTAWSQCRDSLPVSVQTINPWI